jgi:hypothetical protein
MKLVPTSEGVLVFLAVEIYGTVWIMSTQYKQCAIKDYQNNHLTSIRDNFLYAVSLECTPMEEKCVEPMYFPFHIKIW